MTANGASWLKKGVFVSVCNLHNTTKGLAYRQLCSHFTLVNRTKLIVNVFDKIQASLLCIYTKI